MAVFEVDDWLPRLCLLCHQPSGAQNLCAGCLRDLPWVPRACRRCGCPLPAGPQCGGASCGRCALSMRHLDRVCAAMIYEYPVSQLIAAAKFGGAQEVGHTLGVLLASALARSAEPPVHPDCLVPVPLHPLRLARRGYNQAVDIARPVGRALGINVLRRGVRRVRRTLPQTGLGPRERRRNLLGAFRVSRSFAGAQVALIDDVVTTGSTTDALAAELRAAGAGGVQVWAAAVAWKV